MMLCPVVIGNGRFKVTAVGVCHNMQPGVPQLLQGGSTFRVAEAGCNGCSYRECCYNEYTNTPCNMTIRDVHFNATVQGQTHTAFNLEILCEYHDC